MTKGKHTKNSIYTFCIFTFTITALAFVFHLHHLNRLRHGISDVPVYATENPPGESESENTNAETNNYDSITPEVCLNNKDQLDQNSLQIICKNENDELQSDHDTKMKELKETHANSGCVIL